MAAVKRIVILGGGYAGVLTAKHLAKSIKKRKLGQSISVTLIDKNPFHTMLTELHEVAANRVSESSIKMDFKKIFAGRDVTVVLDHIEGIDFEGKKISGREKTYAYDYLVLGAGSKPAFWGVEGAAENAFTLWSYEDAVRLQSHFRALFRKAAAESDAGKRKDMLRFFVVGGGFTGIEMIGELAEWMPFLCKEYGVAREEVSLFAVDAIERILPSLPEKLSEKVVRRLHKTGVAVRTGAKVLSVGKDSITLDFSGNKESFATETVVWTAGIESAEIIKNAPIEKVKGGRVETDEYLESKQYPNVYIVGDNLYYMPAGEKTAVPQMVENCEASAHTAAENILSDMTGGKEKKRPYRPKFHGMMVSVGGRYGTAYVGTHNKKFALPSFFALLSKHMINLLYFVQVLGFHKVYHYLLHEIFRIKNRRSFVGGHFSNYSPTFWTVPLRLFLGYHWLMEGLDKLWKVLANPTDIFLFTIPQADGVASATQAVTDAAASATQAVSAYGEALPVPAFLKGVVDWSMRVFIAPVAPYFQAFMVVAEIVVGLCLIAGLLTAVISIFSCMLCVMIYMSGMAAETILWYFFAAVALIGLGGTGQAFSLDYYFLPWLKERWRKLGFVRKWYLYND